MVIRGFDISLDLEKPENKVIIDELFYKYEIENPIRIVKKSQNNLPMPIITAKTSNVINYRKILKNGIKKLTLSGRRLGLHERPTQCFNCNEIGHTKELCVNRTKWALCSGEQNFKNCSNKENLKCVNCNGAHASFSRICPLMNPAKDAHKSIKPTKNFLQPEHKLFKHQHN